MRERALSAKSRPEKFPYRVCLGVAELAAPSAELLKRVARVRQEVVWRMGVRAARTSILVLAILITGCGVGSSDRSLGATDAYAYATSSRPCPGADADAVVQLVNEVRRRAGLRPLAMDPKLASTAGKRSAAMAAERRLSHSGWERALRKAGLQDDSLGENVAYNYGSPDAVMRGWLQSPGHRANILRRSFKRIGVGCVIDERGHRWWTQDFAG